MARKDTVKWDAVTDWGILVEKNVVTRVKYETVKCKFCGEIGRVILHGQTPRLAQRYRCKACGRTFMDNKAAENMRFPVDAVASALNLYYEAASLHKICRQLKLDYGVMPNVSSVYDWIVKYTKKAAHAFDSLKPQVGDIWVADETVLKLKSSGGENVWLFDCIDEDTRFLLATHFSEQRYTKDAQILLEKAQKQAGKSPKFVITDKLRAYLGATEEVFGADAIHHRSGPFELKYSTRSIERLHGTIKDRTEIMRGLANRESAKLILEGWKVHYNFFRPHQGLRGNTPAEASGLTDLPYRSWAEVAR